MAAIVQDIQRVAQWHQSTFRHQASDVKLGTQSVLLAATTLAKKCRVDNFSVFGQGRILARLRYKLPTKTTPKLLTGALTAILPGPPPYDEGHNNNMSEQLKCSYQQARLGESKSGYHGVKRRKVTSSNKSRAQRMTEKHRTS